MTREEIQKRVDEIIDNVASDARLTEREECAKIAETLPGKMGGLAHSYWPEQIASAIRARSTHEEVK